MQAIYDDNDYFFFCDKIDYLYFVDMKHYVRKIGIG